MQNRHQNNSSWIAKHGIDILRISIGFIFIYFGFLKFFDLTAEADELAVRTIYTITFGFFNQETSLILLATLECVIGLGVLVKSWTRYVISLLFFQMAGTILPMFLFPDKTWSAVFVPTLVGQYIIKNLVLISAAIVLGIEAKGGKLIADPEVATKAAEVEEKKNPS